MPLITAIMKSCISFSISLITGVINDSSDMKAKIGMVKECVMRA